MLPKRKTSAIDFTLLNKERYSASTSWAGERLIDMHEAFKRKCKKVLFFPTSLLCGYVVTLNLSVCLSTTRRKTILVDVRVNVSFCQNINLFLIELILLFAFFFFSQMFREESCFYFFQRNLPTWCLVWSTEIRRIKHDFTFIDDCLCKVLALWWSCARLNLCVWSWKRTFTFKYKLLFSAIDFVTSVLVERDRSSHFESPLSIWKCVLGH